jgi:hypothetical protein
MALMDFENPIVWILGGLALIAIIILFVAPRLSKEARMERRRRKSNARIVSKSEKHTVKFSVRTKDKK